MDDFTTEAKEFTIEFGSEDNDSDRGADVSVKHRKDPPSDNTSSTSGISVDGSVFSSQPNSPAVRNNSYSESVPPSPDAIWQEVIETPDPVPEEPDTVIQPQTKRKNSSLSRLFRRNSSLTDPSKVTGRSQPKPSHNLVEVKVDCLPQIFLVKYLGSRDCHGLWGTQHIRKPVEDMVAAVANMKKGDDLPLCQLQISVKGIIVAEHKENKGRKIEKDFTPIEFISYGVQDVHFSRIFTFIVVKELSSKQRKTECHAYISDKSTTTRKIALSLALAFKEYASNLKGKPHKFQVELEAAKSTSSPKTDV